jgi:HD-GYP domain-containing protein (c-di-GMP phosphodiesterase class II)
VREAVLNKPGPLTDEEYQHIMTHPLVGWQILSPLLGDVPVALRIVRWHHERFDGRGIPDGLAGAEIPLEARIAAVADSFDAMTSSRPYRPGRRMDVDAALAELERNRGTQYDPEVLDVFLRLVRSGAVELITNGAERTSPMTRLRVVPGRPGDAP